MSVPHIRGDDPLDQSRVIEETLDDLVEHNQAHDDIAPTPYLGSPEFNVVHIENDIQPTPIQPTEDVPSPQSNTAPTPVQTDFEPSPELNSFYTENDIQFTPVQNQLDIDLVHIEQDTVSNPMEVDLDPEPTLTVTEHDVLPPLVVVTKIALTAEEMFVLARLGDFPALMTSDISWALAAECRDADGHALLHWAALFDATDFATVLLRHKAAVDVCSGNGQTPIMWAALKGNLEMMRLLFHQGGASLTLCDSLHADVCVLAVQHHQHNATLLLHKWRESEGGCHPMEHPDTSGCTTAHWAAYKGDTLALRLLVYLKTNVNLADNQGMTPLHRAVAEGWIETCQFLVQKCKADIHFKNAKGESSWDIAKRLENQTLIHMWSQNCDDCEEGHEHGKISEWSKLGLPVIFVACTSCVVISFLSDFSQNISFFSLGFIACVVTSIWMFALLITGDPGIVAKRFEGNSAIEELQGKLDSGSEKILSVNRICFSCWEWKGLRSKHCSVCDVCVSNFDHHCGWINNCVAEKNHRQFVLMIFAHFTGMIFYLVISVSSFVYSENESFFELIWTKPLQVPCWLIHLLVLPWLAILVFHQARAITLNLNTNEMINLHRYAHFWEGTTTVEAILGTGTEAPARVERKFKNPFDKGVLLNCKEFWFRTSSQYEPVDNGIEMAAIV